VLYHNEPMLRNTVKMREAGHSEARHHAEGQGRAIQFSIRRGNLHSFPGSAGLWPAPEAGEPPALPGAYTVDS
jgi:hypothetical protein